MKPKSNNPDISTNKGRHHWQKQRETEVKPDGLNEGKMAEKGEEGRRGGGYGLMEILNNIDERDKLMNPWI